MKTLKKALLFSFVAALAVGAAFLIPVSKSGRASLIDGTNYHHELTIILDAAHGSDVAGKASPDGSHREYKWSRVWIAQLGKHLSDIGYNVVYTAPENTEPGLNERVRRMNAVPGPAIVFSLHNNAAKCGEWANARGLAIFTTRGVTRSDSCAEIIYNNMIMFMPELYFRADITDKDHDYEANFTVLMSKHPSVLLEYLFQDNKLDLQLIEDTQLTMTILFILDVSFLQIERYLCPTKKAA
jgi:N-acetylmuramoyl-L-alanine amidase